jgi:cation diffusion facilitator family transporter
MNVTGDNNFKSNMKAVVAALLMGAGIMAGKFYGYWITGSSAILSDALESIINVVASGFAVGSVLVAAKPPDESHPYGHGKIEYFSAGFEGALIILAALGIMLEGLRQVVSPHDLPNLRNGFYIIVSTGLINLGLGAALVSVGKRTGSLVLVADGRHVLTDVYTSGIVLVGVGLVYLTGMNQLDGIVACIAGVNIVFSGVKLVRQAFGGLMDKSDPQLLQEICNILIKNRRLPWIDVHRLRAWRAGNRIHADFHLILPRDLPLHESHLEVKHLEAIFQEHFAGYADILIHLDPCEKPECPVCLQQRCRLREQDNTREPDWNHKSLTRDPPTNFAECKPGQGS